MNFEFFYLLTEEPNPDDWRQKMVWHRTSTGQRNKIKVKSLPADQQWKYAPLEVKMKRKQKDPHAQTELPKPQEEKKVMNFYYSADRSNGFDQFEEGKLVVVTDDSAKAIEIEKAGHPVAVAHQVPASAIRKFWSYEKKDWEDFPEGINDDKKYELIKFSDDDVYLADFFKFKDQIDFQLSDPEGGKEDEEK
jgi:hypothetical protein